MQECEKSGLFKAYKMELLREFSDADVEFVVVGGAAVNLHGYLSGMMRASCEGGWHTDNLWGVD